MQGKSAEDILGHEFDWLATDAEGHVAFLSTAGGGLAPEEFLRDTNAHDAAIDSILALSAVTKDRLDLAGGGQNAWRSMAERGLFAYDSDFFGGAYRLVAAPEAAVHVFELPRAAAAAAGRIVFRNLKFADGAEIPKELVQGG